LTNRKVAIIRRIVAATSKHPIVSAAVPAALHAELLRRAAVEDRTVSYVIRRLLIRAILEADEESRRAS